jgi:adenylate kinase
MHIALFGPPGAGKGTIAKALSNKGYTVVTASDLLREAQKDKLNPFFEEINISLTKGILVSDGVITGLIKAKLGGLPEGAPVLFDGYPRTIGQAESLSSIIGDKLTKAALITAPEDVIIERLTGRLICKCCNDIYHETNMPPEVEGECDSCDGELFKREDDRAEVISDRLRIYEEKTAPLIGYYKDAGIMVVVENLDTETAINTLLKADNVLKKRVKLKI